MNDEIDELRKIIQEAWCAGDSLWVGGDTFGRFLDRAANEIHSQGYRRKSDKAKEIFEEIEKHQRVTREPGFLFYVREWQSLKEKFLEGK